ncbi:hypothetical protein ACRPK0_08380 [Limosilactobacillus reuteri]|uniref:hypothetical protein n=1 Tax=Limosilactobacillus reuteri TaxID=1598 RepID=UPI003D78ACFF
MTNEQVIEKLIDQINNNMQIFLGILGFLVAIFAFFQWRISQSQLKNLKEKVKTEIAKEYHLNSLNTRLDNLKEKTDDLQFKYQKSDIVDLNKKLKETSALADRLAIGLLGKILLENNEEDATELLRSIKEKIKKLMKYNDAQAEHDNALFIYNFFIKMQENGNNKYANDLVEFLKAEAGHFINGGKYYKNKS